MNYYFFFINKKCFDFIYYLVYHLFKAEKSLKFVKFREKPCFVLF